MKVSVDGIIGSAQKINSQRQNSEDKTSKKQGDIQKADSLNINSRVNTRLDAIEQDFKTTQSSLTKNQIINEGINELQQNLNKNPQAQQDILSQTTFNGDKVLANYVGETINEDVLQQKSETVNKAINEDITIIKTLQVEADNIVASNLAGSDKADAVLTQVQNGITGGGANSITSLNPDSVARLIK